MYLKQIINAGVAGFAEWRRMWNQDVLPYLRGQRLIAGRGVRINRLPAGTVIDVIDAGGRGAAGNPDGGYSSYFKLSLGGNGSGGYVVTIADGATGSNSIAVVNGGTTYSIPPYSGAVIQDTLFFLKYVPDQYNSGGQIVSGATLNIAAASGVVMPTLPSGGTSGAYYMQLGRCVWSNGNPRIVQDFTAGVAEFNWYLNCSQALASGGA